MRRKEEINDSYMEKLFDDTASLYRLDSTGAMSTGSTGAEDRDLGPMPATSVILLASLGCAWILILLYVVMQKLKSKK